MTQIPLFDSIPPDQNDTDSDFADQYEIHAAYYRAWREADRSELCTCGHPRRDHDTLKPHCCYWSEGGGKTYKDCECNLFTLPTL